MDERGVEKTIVGVCDILKGYQFGDKQKIHLLESLKVQCPHHLDLHENGRSVHQGELDSCANPPWTQR
jgi:hypothetical protein